MHDHSKPQDQLVQELMLVIVSSDPNDRESMQAEIALSGFHDAVQTASSLDQARDFFAHDKPQLLIYHQTSTHTDELAAYHNLCAQSRCPLLILGQTAPPELSPGEHFLQLPYTLATLLSAVEPLLPLPPMTQPSVWSGPMSDEKARYYDLFQRLSDAVLLLDFVTHRIVEANPQAERLYGYTRDELLGMSYLQLVPREEYGSLWINTRRMAKTREPVFADRRTHIKKDGTRLRISLSGSLIEYNGRLLFQDIVRDETARIEAEEALQRTHGHLDQQVQARTAELAAANEALRASEAQYRTLIEGSILGIGISQDGKRVFANQALATILGYDHPGQLVNRDVLEDIAPHERERILGYRRARQGGEPAPSRYTYQGLKQDGTTVWLERSASSIIWEHRPATLVTFLDITDQKRAEEALRDSEQRLRAIFDQQHQLAGIVSTDGILLEANQKSLSLSGLQSADVIGRPFWDTGWWRHSPALQQRLRDAIAEAATGQFVRFEATHPRPDGEMATVDFSLRPIINDQGQVVFLVPESQDITERKQAEAALQRAHDQLERRVRERTADLTAANEEMKRFTYIVSHDLRAPLINVKGFARELRDAQEMIRNAMAWSHLDASQRETVKAALELDMPEALDFIDTAVSRMDELIQGILKLSRAGRRDLQIEPVDTEALTQRIAQTLMHQLTEHHAHIAIEPLPTINADYTAMEQILSNLLGNAVKYLAPGRPGKITVRAEHELETATFHVIDNGRGIAEQDIPRVFELFRRAGRQDVPGY